MFSQLFQRLAGIVDQIPGFLPGLLKTQKCRVGTFTKLLVGTLAFSQRCSISHHIQDVILNLEGKADALCVLVEYWQCISSFISGA
ncbi:Uncharacterised protein [Klebsiella pneumoniae]|nr:Uncharacterised protein [Klebsiella pneumoniae]